MRFAAPEQYYYLRLCAAPQTAKNRAWADGHWTICSTYQDNIECCRCPRVLRIHKSSTTTAKQKNQTAVTRRVLKESKCSKKRCRPEFNTGPR